MIKVALRVNNKKGARYSRSVKLPAKPCMGETIVIPMGALAPIFGRVTAIIQYVDDEEVSVWIESDEILKMNDFDFDSFVLHAEFNKVK